MSDSPGSHPRFHPDIEGLRAVAILAVLLCHAGIPVFGGGYVGVDVFFVLSGFLITRLVLAEIDSTGTISLARFYARRAKRLLPALVLVLAAVAILSRLLFSPLRGAEVSSDVLSSAFYVVNWHFAAGSVDYFAQDVDPSPVRHLWSLAIEEQFYLVWPTLILLVSAPLLIRGRSHRLGLALLTAAVFGASLIIGVGATASEPNAAYFSTFGRAWELALGAALALLGPMRISKFAGVVVGWLGLAAIVAAALAFDAGTPFPGIAALLPTVGAAAVIFAGISVANPAPAAAGNLLSTRPLRYIGRISYSWYLWHWPALIFAVALIGPLSIPEALAVTLLAGVLAALSLHLVEDPVRHARSFRRPARALALGAGCTVLAASAGLLLSTSQPDFRTADADEVEGAAALASQPAPQKRAAAVRPNPMQAREDRSRLYSDGCLVGVEGTEVRDCVYGDRDAKRTVILFGDSHAMQFFPAIERLAEKHGWRLMAMTKAECPPAEVRVRSEVSGLPYSECETWRERALRRMAKRTGATVLVSSASDYRPLDGEGRELEGEQRVKALEEGYMATLRRIRGASQRLAVIKDPPAAGEDVPSCVSQRFASLDSCAFRRDRSRAEVDRKAASKTSGVRLIDVTAAICPRDLCRAVIGDALVYRDKTHITATFARTLTPWFEVGMRQAKLL